MIIHADSHLDHGIPQPVVDYLLERFASADAFFTDTLELPTELGMVPCALVGPVMGDAPVTDAMLETRGAREYLSRVLRTPSRPTRQLTVIAGPHDGQPCVLYTAFGGPLTPKEPTDPTLAEAERDASVDFWAVHALAVYQEPSGTKGTT